MAKQDTFRQWPFEVMQNNRHGCDAPAINDVKLRRIVESKMRHDMRFPPRWKKEAEALAEASNNG